jgi:hypothetical protein
MQTVYKDAEDKNGDKEIKRQKRDKNRKTVIEKQIKTDRKIDRVRKRRRGHQKLQ